MDNGKTIFPEKLYKHRCCAGDAEYIRIEGNVYEDTTCSHYGGRCRIRVKKVDDHYEFVEPANAITKEYEYFHKYARGGYALLDKQDSRFVGTQRKHNRIIPQGS